MQSSSVSVTYLEDIQESRLVCAAKVPRGGPTLAQYIRLEYYAR